MVTQHIKVLASVPGYRATVEGKIDSIQLLSDLYEGVVTLHIMDTYT